jgi:hypothetical protein
MAGFSFESAQGTIHLALIRGVNSHESGGHASTFFIISGSFNFANPAATQALSLLFLALLILLSLLFLALLI